MPFAPFTNYLTIAFLLMVLVGMWFNDDTRISLIVGVIFLALVVMSYYVFGIGKRAQANLTKATKRLNNHRKRDIHRCLFFIFGVWIFPISASYRVKIAEGKVFKMDVTLGYLRESLSNHLENEVCQRICKKMLAKRYVNEEEFVKDLDDNEMSF